MEKIKMTTPLVEMDGDEMTRILWQYIKDELCCLILIFIQNTMISAWKSATKPMTRLLLIPPMPQRSMELP